jgi:hypothetical protein
MTLASSIKFAALMTVSLAGSAWAAPAKGAALAPSAVSSGALPSCSVGSGGAHTKFISGRAFRGGLVGGMYGQVFFAARGGESRGRESSTASAANGSGGRFGAGAPGRGRQGRGPGQTPPTANVPVNPGASAGAPGDPFSDSPGGSGGTVADPAVAHTPEPGTLLLIGAGLGAVAVRRRRQRQKAQGS